MKHRATLPIILSAIVFAAGAAVGIAADRYFFRYGYPEWIEPYTNPVNWSIRHFVKALTDRDAVGLEQHVRLPFERHYPIPKIETMDEFVAAIPSLFGEEALKRLSESSAFRDWEMVGWRGFAHKTVGVWLSDDDPVELEAITDLSAEEIALWEECARREIASLHESLRDGVACPILSFVTEDGSVRGRIDLLGERLEVRAFERDVYKYRLSVYNASTSIRSVPDAVVMCNCRHEGSPGGDIYTSEDGQYLLMVNYCGPCDFAEIDFYRPGIPEDDDTAPRAKFCEWN